MQDLMQTMTSPLGMTVLIGVLGITLVLVALTGRKVKVIDPLGKLREQTRAGTTHGAKLSRRENDTQLQKRLEKFKSFLEPASETERDAARLEMIQAGYYGRNAVRDFHAAKFIMGVAGLMLGLAYTLINPAADDASLLATIGPVLVPTLAGYYLPIYWVGKRRTERADQLVSAFPDALDLLLVCAEAGQSLDQSIARVGRELRTGYPVLAEEFETVSLEIKAGKDRQEVLRDMGERCGNVDIRAFVNVLIQSATYGTSVIDALRVYAAEMRDKRVMLAEEKANVLPTKLTLGTMAFTVPPLLIILIGPSVYGVMDMFSSMGNFGL